MFAKFRRRRPADTATAHPAPVVAVRLEPAVADADVLARTEQLRTGLHQAGVDLDSLGPEPQWLSVVRAGQVVPLGPDERAELAAYVGCDTTADLASPDACTTALWRIEVLPILREMRADGITVNACGGEPSAALLRTAQEALRQMARERQSDRQVPQLQPGAPRVQPKRLPFDAAAERAVADLEGR
ncbi:hypothetical protein [Streptomyces sp. RKAG293]|uniref:hypothetical protein n=1 Tax=Streptomyces sp. RKAG293 TaxID=2893403 RepID=UPI0020343B92|nr:hypothetical protein [Streptomyces sp. RKAG293]MCM2424219.1 hypothetical protein [Streptomyces sp. RKAG293]